MPEVALADGTLAAAFFSGCNGVHPGGPIRGIAITRHVLISFRVGRGLGCAGAIARTPGCPAHGMPERHDHSCGFLHCDD
eukprot:9353104-Lingulodinium_polyedra.AAC.1